MQANTDTDSKKKTSVKTAIDRCTLFSQLLFGFHYKRNFSSLKITLMSFYND